MKFHFTVGNYLCKAVLTSDKNAEVGGFKIFPDLRIDKTIVDGKPVNQYYHHTLQERRFA
jgi:hypothetical protein